ncbi:HNH endonuclease domain protein [Haladaptatus paucihalophilus DX253]|uniref:HNH endonuclease n=1 Tax=Haladaptatus paucihalophilus DX253 TaxID=797209 RepID=E7QUJ5_HALPU|nr:HNH endonuclease [Haladaptatus paucihalophilus]EFW91652.1 HNH endonuclease domain protein [Haladaptatus paucihalophilus DX253]SHJ98032.1 HNH endonuclease [Haladaptatus paucihalophilus DX253]
MVTWRNAVRVELARHRTHTGSSVFTLDEVYANSIDHLRTRFPGNDHPEAKVRQILQQLRDRDEIEFVDDTGRYQIASLDLADIDAAEFDRIADARPDAPAELPEGTDDPERVRRTVETVTRNRKVVERLKERYDYECQLCGTRRRRSRTEGYAEAHHIEPLGGPHFGPDMPENLLVVCPNHHRDLDYGLLRIDPKTHELDHAYDGSVGDTLTVRKGHAVGSEFLRYHNERIADF